MKWPSSSEQLTKYLSYKIRLLEHERDTLRAENERLRAAERDVGRMEWLESAWGGYSGRDGGFHLSVYMPSNAETLREMIDAAMKGEQQ